MVLPSSIVVIPPEASASHRQRPRGRWSETLRCFRSLLLVTCPHLLLTKTFVPDLEQTRIGDAKFADNILRPKSLYESYQQLMTEAPNGLALEGRNLDVQLVDGQAWPLPAGQTPPAEKFACSCDASAIQIPIYRRWAATPTREPCLPRKQATAPRGPSDLRSLVVSGFRPDHWAPDLTPPSRCKIMRHPHRQRHLAQPWQGRNIGPAARSDGWPTTRIQAWCW